MKGVIDSFEAVRGLPLARWRVVLSYEDLAAFGFPVYLKADVSLHKSEAGAVVRCDSKEDAADKLFNMHKAFPKSRLICQEAFEGVEMIVGLKEDAVFGRVLLVGFGGIFAEVKRDVSFRALPVTRKDVVEMVEGLEGFGVFNSRGKKHDLAGFYDLVLGVVSLAEKKEWKELDLNPVIVGEGKSLIVDCRLRD